MLAHLALGADAHDLMVDAERGVLLRVASEIDGEPFAIAEVEEIAFDETFGPRTFTLELPPQAAVDAADGRGLIGDGELVERDGRADRWRQIGPQRQLETEHLGAHVFAMSDSMPVAALIDLMLSLEPAPTEPPELV